MVYNYIMHGNVSQKILVISFSRVINTLNLGDTECL